MGIFDEAMQQVVFLSLLAGLATVLGGFIVFYFGIPNRRFMAAYLGLAAGVMAMVTVDLIKHAIAISAMSRAVIGILIGAIFMVMVSKSVEVMQSLCFGNSKRQGAERIFLRLGWTMVIGIAAHNIPEGVAIAAGDALSHQLGLVILIAIALHNIPEGIGVTAPLIRGGTARWVIVAILLLVSLCVPVGTLLGTNVINGSPDTISTGLGFAAGAMLYIVSFELLPPAFKQHSLFAQFGAFVGVILIFVASLLS